MKNVLLLSISLLWLVSGSLFAQTSPDRFRFGKVDKEDLELESCSFDPEADAMILGEKADLHFVYVNEVGFKYVYEYQVRIKVLNPDGLDYANVELRLYGADMTAREEVSDLKGFTYNLEDGSVEKEKLDRGAMFEEQISEHWTAHRFTMPRVQVGSVIEYRYSIMSDFLENLRSWEYQREIPVRFSEVKYVIPELVEGS